jgi:hypothetical protein
MNEAWLLMRKLCIVGTTIAVSIGVLIVITRLVGYQQQPSPWIKTLHLNDCQLPCWIGIAPGETTLEAANALIKAKYGNLIEEVEGGFDQDAKLQKFVINSLLPYKFSILFSYKENDSTLVVESLYFVLDETSAKAPALGDLYGFLGSPNHLAQSSTSQAGRLTLLYFPSSRAVVDVKWVACQNYYDKVRIDQAVVIFTIWQESPIFNTRELDERWRGFTGGCYDFK